MIRGSPPTQPRISKRIAAQWPGSIVPWGKPIRSGVAHFSQMVSIFSSSTPIASAIMGTV
jgi:hypothetical protein